MQIFGRYTGKTFIFYFIKFHSCVFEQDLFHKKLQTILFYVSE